MNSELIVKGDMTNPAELDLDILLSTISDLDTSDVHIKHCLNELYSLKECLLTR